MKAIWQLGALALALSACSLAGDLTPPPGAGDTAVAVQPTPVSPATAKPASGAIEDPLTEQMGAVTGQVLNVTLDAPAPAGLPVALHSFDAHGTTPETATTLTTTTTAGGAFQFDAVPFSASRQFVVTTLYGQASYGSAMLAFAPGETTLATVLRVYESTGDASALRVDQVHTFVEFASPTALTVGQLYVFSNAGNATYGADAQARLRFSLPPGATEVSVQDSTAGVDLFATEAGFDLARPVAPGERTAQVLLSFTLPYRGALDYEQPIAYPVQSLNLLITDLNVQLSDSPLQSLGVQEAMGMQFQNFEQTGLQPGEALRFQLSGAPAAAQAEAAAAVEAATTTGAAATTAPMPWGLIAGLGGAGVGLVIGGAWLYRRRLPPTRSPASRADLLQALADLDERQASSQINPADYQRERDSLKQQLREQWS